MSGHQPLIPKARIPWGHLALYGWMPSALKRWMYRHVRGYRIGRGVRFAFGGVVIGKSVDLGDHVEIGFMTVVQGASITIGRHSSIGTQSYISCKTIEIGEDARIREQVFVGGPQLPESRFVLGNRTIILQLAYINPTKPVIIGDDTGIGGHCLIFTHGAWLSALEGYPVTYDAVTLGKSVWLPWRVFVMPGASIGDGSVIGANSLVTGSIPPSSLAVGSPAKVVRSAPDFPRRLSAEERAALVTEMMAEFDRFVADSGVSVDERAPFRTYHRGGDAWRLLWVRSDASVSEAGAHDTVLSETSLPRVTLDDYRARGVHWIDLGAKSRSRRGSPLTEELVQFLGRYGIRPARDA
jgi:acetyltransferase-like isoleucine patch superfamily enzyme